MNMSDFHVRIADDDLVFSAAHFITLEGGACERLHGHTYRVAAEVYRPSERLPLCRRFPRSPRRLEKHRCRAGSSRAAAHATPGDPRLVAARRGRGDVRRSPLASSRRTTAFCCRSPTRRPRCWPNTSASDWPRRSSHLRDLRPPACGSKSARAAASRQFAICRASLHSHHGGAEFLSAACGFAVNRRCRPIRFSLGITDAENLLFRHGGDLRDRSVEMTVVSRLFPLVAVGHSVRVARLAAAAASETRRWAATRRFFPVSVFFT